MYNAPVFKADGQKQSEERRLPSTLFDGVVHEAALWQAVKAYLANQRQGTAATKTRSDVRGGNRKPWRQMGTGRARQGSIRSPQWRGGGNVFGPHGDQNFREKLPRKLKGLARRSAFNARAEDGQVVLIDALSFDAPRTKGIIELMETVGAQGNVLLLTDGMKREVYLSARNISQVKVKPFGEESAYDVLWSDLVVIEVPAIERVPAGEGDDSESAPAPRKAKSAKKAAAETSPEDEASDEEQDAEPKAKKAGARKSPSKRASRPPKEPKAAKKEPKAKAAKKPAAKKAAAKKATKKKATAKKATAKKSTSAKKKAGEGEK